MPTSELLRAAWVDVDLTAIRNNVRRLAVDIAPSELCAVVKADAYGHGIVEVSKAALEGGATWLAVALVEEGLHLRDAGITCPVLVLSQPGARAMPTLVRARLTPTLYTTNGVEALADALGEHANYPVHVKVDTGMHRVGVHWDEASQFIEAVAADPHLRLEGVFTHFANADDPADPFTEVQGQRFSTVLRQLDERNIPVPMKHAANSAAAMTKAEFRFDLCRVGIAMYGVIGDTTPAMSVKANVSLSKIIAAGEAVSYGQNYRVDRPTRIATVPIGYADGVPRALGSSGGEVLIGGRRRPIAGNVTMDQITVDCGDDLVSEGAEVVLIGQQGQECITAQEWADRISTIGYEITCRIGPRLPRRYHSMQ